MTGGRAGIAGHRSARHRAVALRDRRAGSGGPGKADDQSCPRIARIKVSTAGEKRRPDIDTSDTSRTTSGSLTGWMRRPGMVGENSGRKQTPNPAATIIWIQSSRSL